MNTTLILLLFVPLLVAISVRFLWKHEITFLEVGATFLASSFIMCGLWYASTTSQTADVEILNGTVLRKSKEKVSCDHSYSCNCRTVTSGSGKNKTTSTVCDTCYEHDYDYDWTVQTSVGSIKIARSDRQGVIEPKRWTQVQIGEFAAVEHRYTNYIQAVPDNIFYDTWSLANPNHKVPLYPRIFDYYRVNHVINVNSNMPQQDLEQLNNKLGQLLGKIGPLKQVNINVVFTSYDTTTYTYSLEKFWNGGKKNDVTIIIGTLKWPIIDWVDVISWVHNAGNDKLKVKLQDDILDLKTYNADKFIEVTERDITTLFVRPKTADYEYLSSSIEPPTWAIILTIIMSIISGLGIGYYFSNNEYRDRRL